MKIIQQIVWRSLSFVAKIKKKLFTLAITFIPFAPDCVLIIRYDTKLNISISCASNEHKMFKGFPSSLFTKAVVWTICLHLFFTRITIILDVRAFGSTASMKQFLHLWHYYHWKKVSWSVFPSCFLSSLCGSFSIQGHKHLPSIVLPI